MILYAIAILAGVIILAGFVLFITGKVADKDPRRGLAASERAPARALRDPNALRQASIERIGHSNIGALPHQRAGKSYQSKSNSSRAAAAGPHREIHKKVPERQLLRETDSGANRNSPGEFLNDIAQESGHGRPAPRKTSSPPPRATHSAGHSRASTPGPPPIASAPPRKVGPIAPPPLNPNLGGLRQVAASIQSLNPRHAELEYLIKSRQRIAAIKLYREMTGLGLAESKQAVEDLERALNI